MVSIRVAVNDGSVLIEDDGKGGCALHIYTESGGYPFRFRSRRELCALRDAIVAAVAALGVVDGVTP